MGELDFISDGWFKITGRGWVAAITNGGDQLPKGMKPGDLLSRYVKIDGKEYWIMGVETQGLTVRNFGLLIRGEK